MSWVEGQIIGVPYYAASQNPPVVFMNSITAPDPNWPEGSWNTVTVPNIPEDCKAVHVIGVMIITSGSLQVAGDYPSPQPDMTLRLRRWLQPPNTYLPDYTGQVCEARFGGVRSPFAQWVSVDARRFEMYWTRNTPYPHPEYAAYGLKLYVDAYLR